MNLNTSKVITIDTLKEKIESLNNKPYTRSRAKKISKLNNILESMLPQQKLKDVTCNGDFTIGTYIGTGHPQNIIIPISRNSIITIRKQNDRHN